MSPTRTQCLTRAKRETSRDETIMAPESGVEKADPTSGDGAGETSCAETAAMADSTNAANRMIVFFAMSE